VSKPRVVQGGHTALYPIYLTEGVIFWGGTHKGEETETGIKKDQKFSIRLEGGDSDMGGKNGICERSTSYHGRKWLWENWYRNEQNIEGNTWEGQGEIEERVTTKTKRANSE